MTSACLFLALLWAVYCAVHSALISIPVTSWFKAALAGKYRFYRLFFNVFSLATLIPLVMYSHSAVFSSEPLFAWRGYWGIARYALAGLGVVLFVAGARHYSLPQFLGIQQIRREPPRGGMTGSGDFDDTGVLGLVRHPWYVAVFVLLWTSDLNAASITVNLVLSAYLIVGTLLEERKLTVEFGEEYRSYQARVSMFIPLKWLTAGRRRPAQK
jgi:protein-S-isoprenylcysteine O-methyltransferase Ste14